MTDNNTNNNQTNQDNSNNQQSSQSTIPSYRIITHSRCTDGYFSAWIMKRYFNEILNLKENNKLTKEQIAQIPIITASPHLIQKEGQTEIEFTKFDIVLDLPKPHKEILFWCDHHSSNKPDENNKPNYEFHFELADSNTGLLINLALQNAKNLTQEQIEELGQFKDANDTMDMAKYNKDQIMNCYYQKESGSEYLDHKHTSPLLKSHILSSFVHTKDRYLTKQFLDFTTIIAATTTAATPLTETQMWTLRPEQWHIARLKGHVEWREQLDTFVEFDEETKMSIIDKRKIRREYGLFDRFYTYIKFPSAIYNFNIKLDDEGSARIGLGANIFDKSLRKINVGEVLKELASKFGEGAGGGHAEVGGATVFEEHADKAIEFIKEKIKEAHKQ